MKTKPNNAKIALFFGGKVSQHLLLLKKAAKRVGAELDLISYNKVTFETDDGKIRIRGSVEGETTLGYNGKLKNVNDYDVVFFRTTGKHWEEVDLIMEAIRQGGEKQPVIVDPLVKSGKPSYACKAWQMLKLKEAGIDVPKTVYGSLWYLYSFMKRQTVEGEEVKATLPLKHFFAPLKSAKRVEIAQKNILNEARDSSSWEFPVILKGSGGDRGTRVFKADNLEELEKLVRDLRKSETEEGKRYMLQEYIPNDGDYRVLVLGKTVLGVMKRSSQKKEEFRNNYSAGGKVEVADLPEEIKDLAVKAADVCGLWVAGVDVAFRDFDRSKPVIWEVNKGPQFKGFMAATGIDVPEEMIKFLASLKRE